MELKVIERYSEDIAILEKINEEAIPDDERNTIDDMLSTGAELIGIYPKNAPAGFLLIRKYKDICYLAYLAVDKSLRCKGIGSAALGMFMDEYRKYNIVVEYEAPDPSSDDDDMNKRRKDFYIRNGFCETGWFIFYDGTEFEIGCSRCEFDIGGFEEFIDYLGTVITDHIPKPYQK